MKNMKQTSPVKDERIVIHLGNKIPSRLTARVGRSARFGDKREGRQGTRAQNTNRIVSEQ